MNSNITYRYIFNKYPDVVTIEQMCEMLGGISVKTGYKLIRDGSMVSKLENVTEYQKLTFWSI